MSTHAYPLGSDLHHTCSTILLMPFIGSLLPTTTLMQSTTWMIFFLWGQQASNNVPPLSKSHTHFVKGWGFLLPLRNWRDHQHKSTSWALSWIRRPAKVLSLSQDKLRDILQMVQSWLGRHKSTKRELLSLIGKLSFAAKVVPAGRLFLRR